MKLVVKRNPNPWTLLERAYIPQEQDAPDGYEVSTEEDAQAWVDAQIAGGWVRPPPATPVLPVPSEVGSGQIRAALVALGWITLQNPSNADAEVDAWAATLIEAAVADPGQKAIAHLLWRNASGFKRDNQFILLVAAILNKTSAQIDDLFRTAETF